MIQKPDKIVSVMGRKSFLAILTMLVSGCIGDNYEPILGPNTYHTPAVFERLPSGIRNFKNGGDSVQIHRECLKLSERGNADATYAAAIIVGQGEIPDVQTTEDKEREMMRLMYRAKAQGSREAGEFVELYEKVGIQKW